MGSNRGGMPRCFPLVTALKNKGQPRSGETGVFHAPQKGQGRAVGRRVAW